jgi:site-specific DNA recombinase
MLDAVYVDAKKTKSIIAIKTKPPFKPVFQVAASKKDSNIRTLNEPLEGSSAFLVETGDGRTIPETMLRSFPCVVSAYTLSDYITL